MWGSCFVTRQLALAIPRLDINPGQGQGQAGPNLGILFALEGRPHRVVLAAEGRTPAAPAAPLGRSGRGAPLGPVVRAAAELREVVRYLKQVREVLEDADLELRELAQEEVTALDPDYPEAVMRQ